MNERNLTPEKDQAERFLTLLDEEAERFTEVAPFVRTVFSVFKVESLPGVRLPVRPSAASRHTLRPGSFSLILNGAGTCCTSPNTA